MIRVTTLGGEVREIASAGLPRTPSLGLPNNPGAGTMLKKLLAGLWIEATATCACNSMAAKMDANEPRWSLEHMEEILDVMQAEAAKRKLPFSRGVAAQLVRLAVGRANEFLRPLALSHLAPPHH